MTKLILLIQVSSGRDGGWFKTRKNVEVREVKWGKLDKDGSFFPLQNTHVGKNAKGRL